MTTLENKINKLKLENDDLHNFKIMFNETVICMTGELIDKSELGVNESGVYSAGVIANVFIPTDKGYVSTEWKKTDFYKMGSIELTEELFNDLVPFIQSESPTMFFRKTEGWGVAGVIANHINSKVDYASNKMKQ